MFLLNSCHLIIDHCTCTSSIVYVHAQDDDFASSPLGVACEKNQLEVVKILIDNGAMVNYQDKVCFDFHSSCGYILLLHL